MKKKQSKAQVASDFINMSTSDTNTWAELQNGVKIINN